MKNYSYITRGCGAAPRLSAARSAAAPARWRFPFLATAGLCLLGLSGLGGCVAEVPATDPGAGVVALFNPGASPPVVPTPTDLVRVGGTLQIPVDPTEEQNGALKIFNDYLRGLDGFPPDSVATTTFSAAIDPSTLGEGVVVYDATTSTMLDPPEAVASLDAASAGQELVISTKSRWRNGHTYFVGLFSWQEAGAVRGIRSADAKPVLTDSAFALLRSPTPLLAKCQDATNPICLCDNLADSACHAVVDGISSTQARQLEAARLGIGPIIDTVLGLRGRTRSELVMAWSFTISKRSFATFDAGRSQVPFPSNLLLSNQGMGSPTADATVNIPILPTDDPTTKALKGGLNTLDGFSTTGSAQFPVDSAVSGGLPVDIDDKTVLPGKTALLVNLSVPTRQPSYQAQPLRALLDVPNKISGFAGQIWVTPKRPLLGERTTYAAVLTTNIKDASGGRLAPAPVTLLITQGSPLVINGKSAVSTIPLAQAMQLEQLRQQVAPLIQGLGLAPSAVAALTVYRTQSIVSPMQKLIAGTTQLAPVIPSTVMINTTVPIGTPIGAILHGTMTVRRVVDLRGPFNTAARLTASPASNDVIPFLMTLPNPALAPPGGAPVVIVQHGLTRWRGDALAIAGTLASKGLAMIAIDAIYHGGRVICLSSADCATGVTCSQPAPVNGIPQPGSCAGAYLAASGATAVPGSPDLLPDAKLPSRDFTNLANPFAQRDNYRQHTLDLFQLVRVIKDATAGGLGAQISANATLAPINPAKIGYLGQSLGSLMGTNFLALSPSVNLGVLNVGGGDLVGIFTDPTSSLSAGAAAQLGVTPGTPAYFGLLENFRWIIDPADPINFARFVRAPDATLMPNRTAPAQVILQEAGMDTVISNRFTLALGLELGLPVDMMQHLLGIDQEGGAAPTNVSTFFPTADHGAIFNFTNMPLTLQIQNQAATYLSTGLGGSPPTVTP